MHSCSVLVEPVMDWLVDLCMLNFDELVDLRDAVDQSMSPILEGIAMSMVAAYNEL
jgi:hypothetical protein